MRKNIEVQAVTCYLKMAKILLWINEKHLAGDIIVERIICQKAKQLQSEFKKIKFLKLKILILFQFFGAGERIILLFIIFYAKSWFELQTLHS